MLLEQVIWDLVDWADVIIESFTPKAMANWGFDYSIYQEVESQGSLCCLVALWVKPDP